MLDLPGGFPESLIHFGKLKVGKRGIDVAAKRQISLHNKTKWLLFCRLIFAKMQQHDAQMMQMHVKGPQ